MNRKRPAYVDKLVHDTNLVLCRKKIHDEGDSLFVFMCSYLLSKHMYNGFNYYNMGTDYNGNPRPVLAGSSTDYEFLQIY
jgi:hypothetical protein